MTDEFSAWLDDAQHQLGRITALTNKPPMELDPGAASVAMVAGATPVEHALATYYAGTETDPERLDAVLWYIEVRRILGRDVPAEHGGLLRRAHSQRVPAEICAEFFRIALEQG